MSKKTSFILGGLSLLLIVFFSCKIGLGASIDTTPPTIEITQPKVNAVIRDKFCINGTWNDDGEIKQVTVSLARTDKASSAIEYVAEVSDNKTWKCVIDPLDSQKPVLDGTYEATISIADTYEHVTTCSRTFTIDNTPPVMVLQRPSTAVKNDGSDPSTVDIYGQIFTLEGQAADDNDVDLVEILVYSDKECTNLITTITKSNIPPTVSVDLTSFGEDAYSLMYTGQSNEGAKSFYCKILSYDGAQRYPADGSAQSSQDLKGNCADYYYIYNDVSTITQIHKVPEIYHMYSGSSTLASSTIENVKGQLLTNKKTVSKFALNPTNNPIFDVAGRSTLNHSVDNFGSSSVHHLLNDTKLIIDVKPGLDNSPIDVGDDIENDPKVKVYFLECDVNGNPVNNLKLYPADSVLSQSGSSYKFTTTVKSDNIRDSQGSFIKDANNKNIGLDYGKNYLIFVEGEDKNHKAITTDSGDYGFRFTPNGAAPILNIKACVNPTSTTSESDYSENEVQFNIPKYKDAMNAVSENYSVFRLKGTFEVEDATELSQIDFKIMAGDTVLNTSSSVQHESGHTFSFLHDIRTSDLPNSNQEGQKTIKVSVESNVSHVKSTSVYTLVLDINFPTIKINTVDPYAYKYLADGTKELVSGTDNAKKYLNGNDVHVTVQLSDSKSGIMLTDDVKPKLELIQNNVAKVTKYFNDESGQVIEGIDTTQCETGEVTLRITAQDYAGHISIKEDTYFIDQSTDNPVILPKNAQYGSVDLTKEQLSATGNTKNIFSASQSLTLKLIDDDALQSASIKVYDENGSDVTQNGNIQINGETEVTADYAMPEAAGIYKIVVTVKDINNKTTEKTFYARVTASAPKVEIELDNNYATTKAAGSASVSSTPVNSIVANVTIDSNQGPYTIERKIKKNDDSATTEYYTKTFTNVTTENFVDTIDLTQGTSTIGTTDADSGTYRIFYKVTDKNDKSGQKTEVFNVDNIKPVTTITSGDPKGADVSFTFKGKVTEAGSGVGKVEVSFTAAHTDVKEATSSGWYYDCDFENEGSATGLPEGQNTFYVRSIDAVGNIGEWVTKTFVYDKFNPSLVLTTTPASVVNKQFTISGTASDTNGLASLRVYDAGFSKNITLPTVGSDAWTIDIDVGSGTGKLAEGNHTLVVEVKDNAGKITTKNVSVAVDITNPEVQTITTPTPAETESTVMPIIGSAEDSLSGISKVYIGFSQRAAGATDWTGFKEAVGTNIWNVSININNDFTDQWTTEGSKTVYAYAVDNVGNVSAVKSATFIYDKSKPTINSVKYTQTGETAVSVTGNSFEVSKLFTINGSVLDGNAIDSIEITESKDSETPVSVAVTLTGTDTWITEQLPLSANRENGNPKSGTYVYTIVAKDEVGKYSTETKITVEIDLDPPTIQITSPSATASGEQSLSGEDYTFRGTISDTGTSGMKAYYYAITTSSTAPAFGSTDWIYVPMTANGSWTQTKDLKEGTGTNTAAEIYEGHYYFHAYSEDNAGNKSTLVKKEFYVDRNSPVISDVKYVDGSNSVALVNGSTKYFSTDNTSVTLQGKVTDTYGIETLTVGGDLITPAADGTWSKIITVIPDQTMTYEIIATDKSGKETKHKYKLFCDRVAPIPEITNPDSDIDGNNSLSGSTYTFRFAVSDSGSGVKEFRYLLTDTEITAAAGKTLKQTIADNATASDAETNGWVVKTGDGATATRSLVAGKTPATPAANTVYEGKHYIYLYCEDESGNYDTLVRYYWVDKASPSLDETAVDTSGFTIVKNGSVTFGGTVSDVNKITSLKITDDLSTNEWTVTLSGDCETSTAWTQTISAGSGTDKLIDGKHKLTITATDGANKETVLERTVTVDTESPTTTGVEITSTPDWIDSEKKWFKKSTIPVKVKDVQDVASSTNTTFTTGISSVQYTTESGDNPSWIPMTKGTETGGKADWTANVYCMNQGINTIRFLITDKAGNTQVSALSTVVYIDTEKPAMPTTYSVDGVADLTGTKLINGRNNIAMSVTVADGLQTGITDTETTCGISKIVYKGTTDYEYTCTGTAPWTFDIPLGKLKTGSATFWVYDNVGNYSEWMPYSFTLDNVPPTVRMLYPSDADTSASAPGVQVNGVIDLEGTAKDSGGADIESIDICYYVGTSGGWNHLQHITGDSVSNWTVSSIDTTTTFGTIADGTEVILCAIVTDTAGNRNLDTTSGTTVTDNTTLVTGSTVNRIPTINPSAITNDETNRKVNKIVLKVDQDTDRPIIKFSTVDLTGDSDGIIWLKNQTKMVGSIIDDDGIESGSFKIALSDSSTESDWKEITVDGSSWSFDIADFFSGTTEEKEEQANALHNLYFKVKDLNGTLFKSKAANAICKETGANTIKLQSGSTSVTTKGLLNTDKTTVSTSTILPLTVDTLPPTIEIMGGKLDIADEYSSSISGLKYGGDKNSFYIKVKAGDGGNSLKSTNGVTGIATFKVSNTNSVIINATVTSLGNKEYELMFNPTSEQKDALKNAEFNDIAEIKVVAEDKAGNKASQTANLNTDFKNPVITLSGPNTTQTQSGSITTYGTIDSAATMYYALSLDDTTEPGTDENHPGDAITSWKKRDGTTGTGAVNVKPYYKPIVGNSFEWFVYFDNGPSTEKQTHDKTFNQYLIDFGITTKADIDNKVFKDIVKLYLWVKAIDESGNESFVNYQLEVDPQGDAPKVTIDYPETDGAVLGGAVTLRGTATDTIGTLIGIDSVWVQLISAKDNGYSSSNESKNNVTMGGLTFTDTVNQVGTAYTHEYSVSGFEPKGKDVAKWLEAGFDVYKNITSASPIKVTSAPADSTSADDYYIKANVTGSAWSLTINDGLHPLNPDAGKLNLVAYRVCSKDKDNNLSIACQQFGVFDSDTPIISNVYLRQYEHNDTGTGSVKASRAYEPDMWVKGKWWICGSVQDTQGISSLKINGVTQTVSGTAGAEEKFNYALSTDEGVGTVQLQIEATDKATPSHTGTLSCTINYDNKSPELVTSGNNYKISTSIQNSNGFYMFSSQVTENPVVSNGNAYAQSGFDYLAFWFERNITGKHYVYDIMRSKANSAITWSTMSESEGLMWKKQNVIRSSANLGTFELSTADSNIHVGGLCKIGGAIYKITGVDGITVSINGQPEMPESGTTEEAAFAMASVVDNTIEAGSGEKTFTDGKYGYYLNVSNDDGDHMVESVQKSGTTWTWEANINSQNISDGAIILHYVAFDKAGNYQVGSLNANVANNAPRLAGVKVWTDYNENGVEDEGESDTKYYVQKSRVLGGIQGVVKATDITSKLIVSGNGKDYDASGTAYKSISAATTFIPEIVGGNGELYYSRKMGKPNEIASATTVYGTSSFGTGHDDGIDDDADDSGYRVVDDEGSEYIQGHTTYTKHNSTTNTDSEELYKLSVTSTELQTLTNGLTWFNYTIYDSTEGCAAWSNNATGTTGRLSAEFHVALNVLYHDTVKPTACIIPFYWNNKSDNSIARGVGNTVEGHIEFEKDLPSAFTTSNTSGLYDRNPKVSGKIKVEGYAEDDIKLESIFVMFDSHSSLSTAKKGASYSNGIWTGTDYSSTDGWGFSVVDVYCDHRGHKAKWTLTVDTSKVSKVADLDKTFTVYAQDMRGSNTSETPAEKVQTKDGALTCYYQVDVVPYISSIQTTDRNNSGLKDQNIRSANGKYSVKKGSTGDFITVNGFNLKPTSAMIISPSSINYTTAPSGAPTLDIYTDSIVSPYTSVKLKNNGKKSGYLELIVNGIRTLNNINNNDSVVSYSADSTTKNAVKYQNMPNREADTEETFNIQLTDDRYLRFFDMKKTKVKNGYYPVMLMNGNNPVFGYVDKSGGPSTAVGTGPGTGAGSYYNAMAMPQRAEFKGSDGSEVYTEYLIKASSWDEMGMAVDQGGKYYNATVYSRDGSCFTLIYDRFAELYSDGKGWGPGTGFSNFAGEYAYEGANNAITLESVNYGGALGIDRYQNPKLIVTGDSEDSNNPAIVYMSYYDDVAKKICLRNFIVRPGSSVTKGNNLSNSKSINFTENTSYNATYNQGRIEIVNGGSKYFAMGVTSDQRIIILYYDESTCKLVLMYSNTGRNGDDYTGTGLTWTTVTSGFPEYVGSYVSMVLDSSNGIHISAFDAKNSDLCYLQLPVAADTTNGVYQSKDLKYMTVDQKGSVGNWTQIKLNSSGIPYIGYANATENGQRDAVKLAYATPSTTGVFKAGVDSDNYTTGEWEYMTIPAIDPPQIGDNKFQNVCVDFDANGNVIIGYLGSYLEFGSWISE